ncbi:hypothetical protein MERGE_001330 [Pneumocystis wakefieldiae]|uniref:Uncharacterized protein n=1 Tax=Pneumocystis wakefieldiae TaxID=38082 RepID=A0A899G2F3_9ASCO|nr:hypothetical protein MERGE_001330 [Pneumocystis wakefieldiae]
MDNIEEVPNEQELETCEEKELYMIEMLHSLTLKVKVKKMEAKIYKKRELDLQHYLSNTPCEDLSQCEWQLSLLKLMKLRQKNGSFLLFLPFIHSFFRSNLPGNQVVSEPDRHLEGRAVGSQGPQMFFPSFFCFFSVLLVKSRGFMHWLKHLSDKSPFMCRKYRSQTELPGITGI